MSFDLHSSSIQFCSRFIPVNRGGRVCPTLTAISPTPTLHLAQFMASSFSKPTVLLSFSTWIFHIFFCCPHFLLPFTSNSNAFLKTCSSSLLLHCSLWSTLLITICVLWSLFICIVLHIVCTYAQFLMFICEKTTVKCFLIQVILLWRKFFC